MMHLWLLVFLFMLNMLAASPLAAQQTRTINHVFLNRELVAKGYENVITRTSAHLTLVQYEDAVYRYPIAGARDVVKQSSSLLPPTTSTYLLVVQKYGVPLVVFEGKDFIPILDKTRQRTKLVPYLKPSLRADQFIGTLSGYQISNPSRFKTDLIINPDIQMRFGNYDDPVQLQFNVIPELRSVIYDGVVLSASIIVPLYSEFANVGSYMRPGPTTMNYFTRLNNDFFIFAAGGLFRGDRYGIEGGVRKYINNGMWTLDSRIGYSGQTTVRKGSLKTEPWQDITYSVTSQYFFKFYKLFLSLGFHRFVYQDHGLRFDAFRFFHELQLGFWAIYSEDDFNGGFQFSIPLPPYKYQSRGYFRTRTASYFDLSYKSKFASKSGTQLRANTILDDMFLRYHPQYLHSNINLQK